MSEARLQCLMLGRPWCSLCDAMARAMREWAGMRGIEFVVIDIDDDPQWLPLYDIRIPVVVGALPHQRLSIAQHAVVCERRFSENVCDRWLATMR